MVLREKVTECVFLVSLVTVLFAQSPSPEWENSLKQQRLVLSDLDSTSKQEGEYKRFNTLAHYQVSIVSQNKQNEPRHKKTCLRNVRPGMTQTGLLRDTS